MADRPRKIPVMFYRTPAGGEVVLDWLRGLDEEDRHAIGQACAIQMAGRHASVPRDG